VEATWGYNSTDTRPLAERGYYVFPIAVVDQFLKENDAAVVSAALSQVLASSTDAAHRLAGPATVRPFGTKDQGLLYGPYHRRYDRARLRLEPAG
jgi:hypothetical protein